MIQGAGGYVQPYRQQEELPEILQGRVGEFSRHLLDSVGAHEAGLLGVVDVANEDQLLVEAGHVELQLFERFKVEYAVKLN